MTARSYPTPEAAAMEGFPPEHCRVVAVAVGGDAAYVLLDTGSPSRPYLYGSIVVRGRDGWGERSSHNGNSGWSRTDAELDVGVVYHWDEAPAGVTAVQVEWAGNTQEVPVENDVYLAAWWRQYDIGE